MPADLGPSPETFSAAKKNEALEAMASRCRLTPEQAQALAAVGVGGHSRYIERPWGSDDDATARRLARVRGWSPTAIGAFLNRPEAQVRAALAGYALDQAGSHP